MISRVSLRESRTHSYGSSHSLMTYMLTLGNEVAGPNLAFTSKKRIELKLLGENKLPCQRPPGRPAILISKVQATSTRLSTARITN